MERKADFLLETKEKSDKIKAVISKKGEDNNMGIAMSSFGVTAKGREATLYTFTNKSGMQMSVTDFGAALVSVKVPDKNGDAVDVVLGYDDVKGYEEGTLFFGASVGRNANRIAGASFEINGREYKLDKNDNGNNLHSGNNYYNKRMWGIRSKNYQSVTFDLHSMDGDQGFPGALDMEVKYTLTDDNEVKIEYYSVPSEDTIINMTNHSYFNLNGHSSGSVLEQEVGIAAKYFTPADGRSIPTGELVEVAGTPMDFNEKKPVGRDIEADYEALVLGHGYDHNWALDNHGKFDKAAEMSAKESGITMEVYTDLPGMQLYTANFVENEKGKDGAVYGRRHAVCFETQFFPDAIHHRNFKSPVCPAGENYRTLTVYKFSAE